MAGCRCVFSCILRNLALVLIVSLRGTELRFVGHCRRLALAESGAALSILLWPRLAALRALPAAVRVCCAPFDRRVICSRWSGAQGVVETQRQPCVAVARICRPAVYFRWRGFYGTARRDGAALRRQGAQRAALLLLFVAAPPSVMASAPASEFTASVNGGRIAALVC